MMKQRGSLNCDNPRILYDIVKKLWGCKQLFYTINLKQKFKKKLKQNKIKIHTIILQERHSYFVLFIEKDMKLLSYEEVVKVCSWNMGKYIVEVF